MLLAYAVLSAGLAFVAAWMYTSANRRFQRLRDVEPPADWIAPKVSIVVAARNEARDIEPAILSLFELQYESLQLTVVNDRSTDETGPILDRLATQHPTLNVVHLESLPDGWLGKNHAQHLGAERSDGEWLLFTDADIVFEPTSLRRAVWWAEQEALDHVAAAPDIRVRGFLLNAFVATFIVFFNVYFRPWRARDPKSKAHIGIGAFNLIRTAAYRAIDGHKRLKLRPDDDVKLGKVLKNSGYRQDLIIAADMISVPWYASVSELILGLEKNAFAGVDYNPFIVFAGTLSLWLFNLGPFVAALLTEGLPQLLFAIAASLWLYCCWQSCLNLRVSRWYCLGFPLAVALLAYIQWRTMLLNWWLGGIRWRDTLYPLDQLRANRV